MSLLRCCKYFVFRKSYFSETGEDITIKQFTDKSPGRYIDVGAHHPLVGSNTFNLYTQGWSGIAVEPQTNFNFLWKLFRRRDALINSPVSSKPEVIFHYFTNSLLNTTDSKVANIHKSDKKWLKSESVSAVRLQTLLPHKLHSCENFVLSIDIEGSELDALKTVNWRMQKPRIILLESWARPWIGKSETHLYLVKRGYTLQAYTGLTSVYVAQEFLLSRVTLKEKLTAKTRGNHDK